MESCLFRTVANDRYSVWKLGITHVLNAAHGRAHSEGSQDFYGTTVDYYGVPADDSPTFDLSRYFAPSAEFIHTALDIDEGTPCLIELYNFPQLFRPVSQTFF